MIYDSVKKYIKKIFSRKKKITCVEKEEFVKKIKKLIGFSPKNIHPYCEAFTHPSYHHEGKPSINYERLEFLGDAILSAIVAHHLYTIAPSKDEGYMTKMRSKIVGKQYLNKLGKDMELHTFLRTETPSNQLGNNVEGDIFEALIGAIYIDQGYEVATNFVHRVLINNFKNIDELERKIISYKSLIVECTQKRKNKLTFKTEEEKGVNNTNDRNKIFCSQLFVDGNLVAKGRDRSKKKAEEKAAKRAYYKWKSVEKVK